MKLYTSRYSNKQIELTDLAPVGISLGNPRFKTAFKVLSRIRELAPTRDMLQMEYKQYKKKYFAQLNSLEIKTLKDHIKKAVPDGKKDIVLLCFEDLSKEGEWCHRRMFAEWWERKTGQAVEELNTPARQYPLILK